MSFQKVNIEDTTRSDEKISVMVYGYNEDEIEIIKEYCNKQKVDNFIKVENEMLEMTLEDILNKKKGTISSENMNAKAIIMNGFSGSELQSFLKNFKDTKLERPIFATVTPISRTWKFKNLIKELQKEHKMMTKKKK
ncbi:DUF3783 domain-containing protein [Defluviitalea phaphyphila]|uniref:DUF3783 domain-containing protein n=1 Tax=Defluviitalea phaphyphila TaxID=1473580 RepID=UPI0007313314|nr:DUF3783 domain-containing protein [Defluviitalea phaphyphila]